MFNDLENALPFCSSESALFQKTYECRAVRQNISVSTRKRVAFRFTVANKMLDYIFKYQITAIQVLVFLGWLFSSHNTETQIWGCPLISSRLIL